MNRVAVRVDDRLRLVGCLLAAADWPEREQACKPYQPHRVADGARRYLAPQRNHPAVQAVQALVALGQDGDPARLFAHALAGDWPGALARQAADFATRAGLERFYADTQAEWQSAAAQLERVLARADPAEFLASLFGNLDWPLVVFPNLLYPGRRPVTFAALGEVVLSQPPPPAWGSSPPWGYDERPDEVLAALAEGLARALFELAQGSQKAELRAGSGRVALAVAVLFLRAAEGPAAADQFMLMEQRARGLPRLPALVEALGGCQGFADVLRLSESAVSQ
jgi:hypothetical protein